MINPYLRSFDSPSTVAEMLSVENPAEVSYEIVVTVGLRDTEGIVAGKIVVVPLAWLVANAEELPLLGYGHLIVANTDEEPVARILKAAIEGCSGSNIAVVLEKLSRVLRLDT